MWIKPILAIAIFCHTFALVSAWSIDETCGPEPRIQNLKDVIKYIMQWPDKVDKNLGNDDKVNTYAKNLFNEEDWDKVKKIINAVGTMSKEDASQSDPMDPIIYCNLKRMKQVRDATDPSKSKVMDTKHNVVSNYDDYRDCLSASGQTLAYTTQWISSKDNKRNTYIQLCPRFLKQVGQGLFQGDNGDMQVKKLSVTRDFMEEMRGTPTHIDQFAVLHTTIFHEFVHTWKVKIPQINDTGGVYWDAMTTISEDKALDNADSYAYIALGTWIISGFRGTISQQGLIQWSDVDDSAKRNERIGLPWFG